PEPHIRTQRVFLAKGEQNDIIMKTRILVLISALAILLPSCDDYLDLKPKSVTSQENAYNTANDAEAALIGAYDSFAQEYYIWDNVLFSDVRSDNHYAGGDNPEI